MIHSPHASADVPPEPPSKPQTAKLASEMAAKMEEARYEAEDLDEAVHQAKSDEATRINDGGLEKQIAYLLEDFSGDADAAWAHIWHDLLGNASL